MKLYSKEYYDSDQDIRDDYKMHAEKDDKLMEEKKSISDEIREAFKEWFKSEFNPVSGYVAFHAGYIISQQKSQAEIEEITESLGTYYDMNMKLEQQIKQLIEEIEGLKQSEEDSQRVFNRLQKRIKDLEQQVVDTETALTGAIDCINDMKCCGNCSWWSGRICTHSEWCIRSNEKNDMCINDLWCKK